MISVAKGASADINVQNKDSCYQEGRNLPVCVPGSVQARGLVGLGLCLPGADGFSVAMRGEHCERADSASWWRTPTSRRSMSLRMAPSHHDLVEREAQERRRTALSRVTLP